MPKYIPLQVNFAAGELSPDMHSRFDLEGYLAGAFTFENNIALPQGPFKRRFGFLHKGHLVGTTGRMFGFANTVDVAFQVAIPPATENIKVIKLSDGTVVDTGVASPYTAAQLPELQFAMVPGGESVFIAHRNVAPKELSYNTGTGAFTLADIVFTAAPATWTGTNWPGVVCFHQGRSWWAGAPDAPETFIASVSGFYKNLTTGPNADDALSYTLANRGIIQWMVSHKLMLMGTENSEYTIASSGGIIIPGDIQADRQSSYGSAYIQAWLAGSKVLYVSTDRRVIRDIDYKWTEDGWISRDILFVSNHIFKTDKIKEIIYAPNANLLAVATDAGKLVMATYERGNDIIGWHRHPTEGTVKSIGVVSFGGDDLISGLFDRTNRQVGVDDVLEIELYSEDVFLDGSSLLTGPISAVTGLLHLADQTVGCKIDGAIYPDLVIDNSGDAVLPVTGDLVELGFHYTSTFKSLPLVRITQAGSNIPTTKGIGKVFVRILESAYPKIQGKRPPTRSGGTVMDEREALKTELISAIDLGYDEEKHLLIEQDLPLATKVTGLFAEVEESLL